MESRNEDILHSILRDSKYETEPQSRIEALLIQLGELIRTGGATPEQIESAVNAYLDAHPVSGMSKEEKELLETVSSSCSELSVRVEEEIQRWFEPAYTFSCGYVSDTTGCPNEGSYASDGSANAAGAVTNELIPVEADSYITLAEDCPDGSGRIVYYDAFGRTVRIRKINTDSFPVTLEQAGSIRIAWKRKDNVSCDYDYLERLPQMIVVHNRFRTDSELAVNIEPRPMEILCTLPGSVNDGVVIGSRLYLFSADSKLYIADKYTGKLLETRRHSLGHMNSVDYNPLTDKLIFSDSTLNGTKADCVIYVYENFSTASSYSLNDAACKSWRFSTTAGGAGGLWARNGDYAFIRFASSAIYDPEEAGIWYCNLADLNNPVIVRKLKGPAITQSQGHTYDGHIWMGCNWETMGATEYICDLNAGVYKPVRRVEFTYKPNDQLAASYKIECESTIRDGAYLYLTGQVSGGDCILGRMQVGEGGSLVDEEYAKQLIEKEVTPIREMVTPQSLQFEELSDAFKEQLMEYVLSHMSSVQPSKPPEGGPVMTDEPIDLSKIMGFVPLGAISGEHSVMFAEFDLEGSVFAGTQSTIASTRSPAASTGMGHFAIQHKTSNGKAAVWFMPVDSSDTDTAGVQRLRADLSTANVVGGVFYGSGYKPVYQSGGTGTEWEYGKSGGVVAAHSGFYCLNFTASEWSPEMDQERFTELVDAGTVKAINKQYPLILKHLIIFRNKDSWLTREEILAHRAESDIDLRIGSDGRIYNCGTSGEFIYTEV